MEQQINLAMWTLIASLLERAEICTMRAFAAQVGVIADTLEREARPHLKKHVPIQELRALAQFIDESAPREPAVMRVIQGGGSSKPREGSA